MACPTCDYTMQIVNTNGHFWCPRCGTYKILSSETANVPMLVQRCRLFETDDLSGVAPTSVWFSRGIAESINLPGERDGKETR